LARFNPANDGVTRAITVGSALLGLVGLWRQESRRSTGANWIRALLGQVGYLSTTAGERLCPAPFGFRIARRGFPSPSGQPARGIVGGPVANTRSTVLLRSVEDLAEAKELRAAISAALGEAPMNEHTLRCAVWSFVEHERRAGVPPALVIVRLTALIDGAKISPTSAHLALTNRVILWCAEAYFGHLGGDALALDRSRDPQTLTNIL
jgi:hypothetical protein